MKKGHLKSLHDQIHESDQFAHRRHVTGHSRRSAQLLRSDPCRRSEMRLRSTRLETMHGQIFRLPGRVPSTTASVSFCPSQYASQRAGKVNSSQRMLGLRRSSQINQGKLGSGSRQRLSLLLLSPRKVRPKKGRPRGPQRLPKA